MHKIPLDETTGPLRVYHRRATIELALTCVINNCNTTLNNHYFVNTHKRQTNNIIVLLIFELTVARSHT